MSDISTAQVRCIKTLVSKLKIADADALVRGYSGYRTEHVSDLTNMEAIALTKHLKGLDPDEEAADRMRKKLYGIGYGYHGLSRSATKAEKLESRKRTEAWVLQYGYKKKALNSYTKNELPLLVSVYEKVNVELLQKI